MGEAQVKKGELYRRKKGGQLVRVMRVARWETQFDVYWEGHDFKGKGVSWEFNFIKNYTKVEEPNG
jgi:hypothetical protein